MELSRRRFAQVAGTAALAGRRLAGQQTPPTAQQVIDRVQKNVGIPWKTDSLDTIKAGDAATVVTGIATTAMATMDVLSRAAKEKVNLVFSFEPAFFGGKDAPLADDPVYAAKLDFIRQNGMAIWRFSDHWHARKPDPFATGLARTLAWTKYQIDDDASRYDLPGVTIGALVDDLAKRLNARAGIRVVGDPQTRVRRVTLLPGSTPLAATLKALPECDVVIAGETREWESVEYAQDTVASGQKKGLIMLGRVVSEEPGMNLCGEWLKTLVPEVPVRAIPAGDPYWRPTA
jgi:putative NIF3 family GTP cyclohydrolase 1 type 2